MKKITTILVILALVIGILTANGPVMASPGNLTNAGFETGNLDGWSTGTVVDFAGVVAADSYTAPYHGSYMTRLGTPGTGAQPIGTNRVFQNFTVTEPPVSFAYNIFTYDATNDHFHYKVTDLATGSTVAYYAQSSWGSGNTLKNTGWRPVTLDLSGYMGKQLRLEFDCGGTGDERYATWCYIDNALTLDIIPPTTTLSTSLAQNANGWVNANVTVNLSSSDNPGGSGIKEIHYSINGGGETIVLSASASFGLSVEGNYTISYYARDQANNSESPNSRVIKIDRTPPGPTNFTSVPPAFSNSTSASFSWASNDNITPAASLVYQSSLDGAAFGDFFSGASTGLNGLSNGSHNFKVKAKDLADNLESTATSYAWIVDTLPPTITASATTNGSPYTSGTWTNKDVVVSFTCADNPDGSGITINTVAGATVSTENTPGATQSVSSTGTCTDRVGNTATPVTFSGINIDKTSPSISAVASPLPNALGWNNVDVTINFTCTDGLSGVASCGPTPQIVSDNGSGQSRTATVVDKAGNQATATVGNIKVDKIKPTTYAGLSPAANANGWNNTPVSVSLANADNLSGVVTKMYNLDGLGWQNYNTTPPTLYEGTHTLVYYSIDRADNREDGAISILVDMTAPTTTATTGPVVNNSVSVSLAATDNLSGVIKTEYNLDGAGWTAYTVPFSANGIGAHALLFRSIDKAGNQEGNKALNIPISIDPPEAFNQFDPTSKDILVYARYPGAPSGPVTPFSVVPIKWGHGGNDKDVDDKDKSDRDKDDDKDKDENAELRTYRITNGAGSMVLIEKVKKTGHEIKVKVVSIQYNSDPVITPPKNRKSFEWSTEKEGPLKELEQEMEVGKGKDRQDVEARYDAKKNETTIRVDETKPEIKIVKTGLALLRLATDKGKLVIEY